MGRFVLCNPKRTVRTILIAFVLFQATFAADIASAQNNFPPPKTDLGFDSSKVPPPDPKKGKPVARVLDQYIYPDQPGLNSATSDKDEVLYLQYYIIGPLFDRLKEREKINATSEEIAQLEAFLKRRKVDTAGALTHLWFYRHLTGNNKSPQDRIDAIVLWKIERILFKRYDGTVALSKFRSSMPIDAYHRFLEDAQRTRAFEIFDKEHRNAFFEQLRQKPRFTVPPDKVDFDTPWWVQN